MRRMPRRARIVTWNGRDLPVELRDLPAGRYVVEAVEEEAPVLTSDEEAGVEDLRDARRSSCLARISGSHDTRHRTRRSIETRLVDEAGGPDPLRLSIAVLGP